MGFVNSLNNVWSYGFRTNEALVGQCVNNGIGSHVQCAALSGRVGLVACADFAARGLVGMYGIALGVQGLQNLFAVRQGKTGVDKALQLTKSAFFFGGSAAMISVAFLLPVVTVNDQGRPAMVGAPFSRV